MRNQPRKLILPIENDPIRTGRPSIIHLVIIQNRVLVVCARDGEVESFVVVVDVRVVVDRAPFFV